MNSRSLEEGSFHRVPSERRDPNRNRSEYQIMRFIFLALSCRNHLPTQPSPTSPLWQHHFFPGPIQVSSFAPIQHSAKKINSRLKKGIFDPLDGNGFMHDIIHAYPASHSSTPKSVTKQNENIKEILKRYGFGKRLISLRTDDLQKCPIPAEMFDGGSWKLCLVVGLRTHSFSTQNPISEAGEKPPLIEVLVMDENGMFVENKVVDLGESGG